MCRMGLTILLWLNVVSMASGRTLRADLNGDCRVDMQDLMILLSEWMMEDEDCLMGLGPELVTNGGFDTDSDWVKEGFWSIDVEGGLALYNPTTNPDDSFLSQTPQLLLEAGHSYQISIDLLPQAGNGYITVMNEELTGTGTKTFEYSPEINTNFLIAGSSTIDIFICYIDNVSVREVLSGGLGFGPTLVEHAYENF